jgi:hypothetical protein
VEKNLSEGSIAARRDSRSKAAHGAARSGTHGTALLHGEFGSAAACSRSTRSARATVGCAAAVP